MSLSSPSSTHHHPLSACLFLFVHCSKVLLYYVLYTNCMFMFKLFFTNINLFSLFNWYAFPFVKIVWIFLVRIECITFSHKINRSIFLLMIFIHWQKKIKKSLNSGIDMICFISINAGQIFPVKFEFLECRNHAS